MAEMICICDANGNRICYDNEAPGTYRLVRTEKGQPRGRQLDQQDVSPDATSFAKLGLLLAEATKEAHKFDDWVKITRCTSIPER